MKPILVYVTTSGEEEAKTLSKILLSKKLIACSNVFPKMNSFYTWEGKSESSDESVLLLKSFESKYAEIEKTIEENHSYEVPCLITLPIASINEKYLEWMKSQVQ